MTTINRTTRLMATALALQLTGCATAARSQMSSLLIRQGEPTLSFDAPDASGAKPQSPKPSSAGTMVPTGPTAVNRMASANAVETADRSLSQALKSLDAAKTATNHLLVAAEYRRLKIMDEAYEHATSAVELDHRSVQGYEQRAQIWRDWGLPQLGLADAHRAVYLAPRSASAQNTLGTLLQAAGHNHHARLAYRKAIELDQSAGYTWSNLCYLSIKAGAFGQAMEECHTAIKLSPGLSAARNNMAVSYASAGKLEAARDELLAGGNRATAAFNLGMLYLSAGQYQRAEESFRTATELRPHFTAAEKRRRQAARLSLVPVN